MVRGRGGQVGSRDKAVIESRLGEVWYVGVGCCVLVLLLVLLVCDGCGERSGMTRVRRTGGWLLVLLVLLLVVVLLFSGGQMDFTGDDGYGLTTGTAAGARSRWGWGLDTAAAGVAMVVMGTNNTFSLIMESVGVDAIGGGDVEGLGVGMGMGVVARSFVATASGTEPTTTTALGTDHTDDCSNVDDVCSSNSCETAGVGVGIGAGTDRGTGVTEREEAVVANPPTVDRLPVCTVGHFLTPPER